MNTLEYIIERALAKIITEAPAQETDNAPSAGEDSPFTPAEEKFLGKFDARGTTHIGIIYSPSDIGIREFISRSGAELNLTPGILLNLLRKKIIKIVPYTGYGRNTDYTLELQLSLDDVSGLGDEEKKGIESGKPAGASPADAGATEELPAPAPGPEVSWVIPYGTLIKESTIVAKQILSEKASKKKQDKSKVHVNKSRVLKRLPKSYITELERIIDMMSKRTNTAHEKQRIIADILDNLAINFNLNDKQIKKSYEFYKNQKRLQESLEPENEVKFIYESIINESSGVSAQRKYLEDLGLTDYINNALTFWDKLPGVFSGYGFDWDEDEFFNTFKKYLWGASVPDKRKQAIINDAIGIILAKVKTKVVTNDVSYVKFLNDWLENWNVVEFPINGKFIRIADILNNRDIHLTILDETDLAPTLINGLNINKIGKLSGVSSLTTKAWFPTYSNTDIYKMIGELLQPYRAKTKKDAAGRDVVKPTPADKLSVDQKTYMSKEVIKKINNLTIYNAPKDNTPKINISKIAGYGGAWVDTNAKPFVFIYGDDGKNKSVQTRLYSDRTFKNVDTKTGKVLKSGKYWLEYSYEKKQPVIKYQYQ